MIKLITLFFLVIFLLSCGVVPKRRSKKSSTAKPSASVQLSTTKEVTAPKVVSRPNKVKRIVHKVKKGEWLSSIAKKYGTTTENLLKINPQIKSSDRIKNGQLILISKETQKPAVKNKQSTELSGTKTVTTVGVAYLGSEITLEEAKTVALTDAQSIALNKLGVFVEASSTVQNFQLTNDVVRSITGAIMKSTVIKEEKKVQDKTFTLYLTVTSQISLNSLREALQNYQNRSKDRNLILRLMATVKKLRNKLETKAAKGAEELELVDELVFSNQRINEFLTTRMIIDKELELQNIYINKFKNYLNNEIFPAHRKSLIKNDGFNAIPQLKNERLILTPNYKFIRNELTDISKSILRMYLRNAHEYDKLSL
jgi:murein DD-endopeptidase MepM/ murein hydrolase activator NlpD